MGRNRRSEARRRYRPTPYSSKHKQNAFAETNQHMLEKEILCDVTFLTGQKEERVRAHRFMLASRSPGFRAMFCEALTEPKEEIKVPDIETNILKTLFRYIYTADCIVSNENVMALYYAALKYAVEDLVKKCRQFLTDTLGTDTVCTVLQKALAYNELDLVRYCLEYIMRNGKDVLNSVHFKYLDKPTLMRIIELDNLFLEEGDVYKACVDWAKYQCQKHEMDISDQNIRECLGEVLYLIRFPAMPMETFSDVVSRGSILTADEKVAVFQSYGGVAKCSHNFPSSPRSYLGNSMSVNERFETIGESSWDHDGTTDAISFSCSNDVNIVAVGVFTPAHVGSVEDV